MDIFSNCLKYFNSLVSSTYKESLEFSADEAEEIVSAFMDEEGDDFKLNRMMVEQCYERYYCYLVQKRIDAYLHDLACSDLGEPECL